MRRVETRFVRVRDGADAGQIYAMDSGAPILRMDSEAEIKTSLRGSFAYDPAADWLRDRIRPELIIDGESYPLGSFLPATVDITETESTKTMKIEAFDQCWLVRDTIAEGWAQVDAGRAYLSVVEDLLNQAGVVTILETPNAATLAETRLDWGRCASYLTVINDLLSEINYKPLWFNNLGLAILEPVSVPSVENIRHTLDASVVTSMVLPGIQKQTDVFSAPNVFICTCANPDKTEDLYAQAENNNPQSPLSIPRRGRRIYRLTQLKNIESQDALQAYADNLRDASLYVGERFSVQTALLPGFGVDDVIALHYGDLSAICIERAWSMELKPGGTMSHELERVVINLG